jgi:hypothetical protein
LGDDILKQVKVGVDFLKVEDNRAVRGVVDRE